MSKQPAASKWHSRCLPATPQDTPEVRDIVTSVDGKRSANSIATPAVPTARTGSSGSVNGDSSVATSFSSALSSSSTTGDTPSNQLRGHVTNEKEGGSRRQRQTRATKGSAKPSTREGERVGCRAAALTQPRPPPSSPKAVHRDISVPPLKEPSPGHSSCSSPLPSKAPASSSLARLRALAGLTPVSASSSESKSLSQQLHRNEESPLRRRGDFCAELGGNCPSSTSSSCLSSPYTSELAHRLSFLNGTTAHATLAVLRTDRLKRSRSGPCVPPSRCTPPSLENEEEEGAEGKRKESPGGSMANGAVDSTDLRPTSSSVKSKALATLYDNEESADGGDGTAPELDHAKSTVSLLGRLRAANPRVASASEKKSDRHPYLSSANGVVGGAPAIRETPVPSQPPLGPPCMSVTKQVEPDPLLDPSTSVPPCNNATRLAQLRQRASSSATSSSHIANEGSTLASSAASVPTLTAPWSSLMNPSRLRGQDVLPQPRHIPLPMPRSVAARRKKEEEEKRVLSRGPPLEVTAGSTQQQDHTLTKATTAATWPVSIGSDRRDLGLASCTAVPQDALPWGDSSVNHVSGNATAKASGTRAPSRKSDLASNAKKESAGVALKARLAKGTRSNTRCTNTVTSLDSQNSTVRHVPAKQVMNKLRSLAAPVPIGEPGITNSPAATSLATSIPDQPSQSPPSLPPSKSGVVLLPPSWSTPAPFAAMASQSLRAARAEDSTRVLRGGEGSNGEHMKVPPLSISPSPYHAYKPVTQSATATSKASPKATSVVTASATSSSSISSQADRCAARTSGRRSDGDRNGDMTCLVFDTSSLLDSEPGVMNLLLEKWRLGIPFTVLDELDRMHKDRGGGGGKTDNAAITANTLGVGGTRDREWRRQRAHELRNWIAACLSDAARSHLLLLQKRTEVVEGYDKHANTNDDRILGYAVYLNQCQGAKVIFVTEDKFLRIKASSELGKAYTYSEIRKLAGMPPLPTTSPVTANAKKHAKKS